MFDPVLEYTIFLVPKIYFPSSYVSMYTDKRWIPYYSQQHSSILYAGRKVLLQYNIKVDVREEEEDKL